MRGAYFGDDFEFVVDNPRSLILGAFLRLHPYRLYRPLEFSASALARTLFGETTLPMHILNLVVHGALTALILQAFREWKAPRFAMIAALGWMTFAQSNAPALGGNDTFSLVLGTFAGTAALWLIRPRDHVRRVHRIGALVLYAIALLSKESSLGYLPVLVTLSLTRSAPGREHRGLFLLRSLSFPVVTLLYMLIRQKLGGELPQDSPRAFALGANVIVNSAMIFFGALTPVSTLAFFTGTVQHRWLWPAAGTFGVLVVIAVILGGVRLERRAAFAICLALIAECSIAPMLFQLRVSELYGYALLPFVAVLFGGSMGALFERARSARTRVALIALLAILLASHAQALREKAEGMARNGQAAKVQMANMLEVARGLPRGTRLVLVEPVHELPEYSVYRMIGFRLTPAEEIERLSNNRGISVRYAGEAGSDAGWNEVRVTLEGHEPRLIGPVCSANPATRAWHRSFRRYPGGVALW